MTDEMKKLNPEIKEIEIGTRVLRSIKVYPLSYRDQEKLTAIIGTALERIRNLEDQSPTAFISVAIDEFSKNAEQILKLVMDPEDFGNDLFAELTNNQIIGIGEAIYQVNFERLRKKVEGLFGTLTKIADSLPERPLRESSEAIPNTTLRTSSGEASGTAG